MSWPPFWRPTTSSAVAIAPRQIQHTANTIHTRVFMASPSDARRRAPRRRNGQLPQSNRFEADWIRERGALWRDRPRPVHVPSETKQSIHLDDECAVGQVGHATGKRVTLVVVDDEQLTAWAVFPPKPDVGRGRAGGGVVLQQR